MNKIKSPTNRGFNMLRKVGWSEKVNHLRAVYDALRVWFFLVEDMIVLNLKNPELGCAGIPYKYKAVDILAQEHLSEGKSQHP